ncbi:hypothetical protein MVEN_00744600 [Mycena venus]|uniref:Uncharacterized protein n=1 Tax=Mycena venus TaxID=2733690 RepID=A0A8H7D5Z9_9AGAR|nr:hypothetical protein MVEN_00744600 [Mycena venus]
MGGRAKSFQTRGRPTLLHSYQERLGNTMTSTQHALVLVPRRRRPRATRVKGAKTITIILGTNQSLGNRMHNIPVTKQATVDPSKVKERGVHGDPTRRRRPTTVPGGQNPQQSVTFILAPRPTQTEGAVLAAYSAYSQLCGTPLDNIAYAALPMWIGVATGIAQCSDAESALQAAVGTGGASAYNDTAVPATTTMTGLNTMSTGVRDPGTILPDPKIAASIGNPDASQTWRAEDPGPTHDPVNYTTPGIVPDRDSGTQTGGPNENTPSEGTSRFADLQGSSKDGDPEAQVNNRRHWAREVEFDDLD